MHKPYSQRTSLMVVSIVGCIALWVVVIAFTNMNNEINQLEKDVALLKTQLPRPSSAAPMPTVPTPPEMVPALVNEPSTPPPSSESFR